MSQFADFNHENLNKSLSDLINSPGQPVDYGCDISDLEVMLSRCNQIDNSKLVCSVEQWMLWDVGLTLEPRDDKVLVVYANNILDDQAKRFITGGWVRSTPVISINEKCIFTTQNTHYLLIGEGTRKPALAADVLKLR